MSEQRRPVRCPDWYRPDLYGERIPCRLPEGHLEECEPSSLALEQFREAYPDGRAPKLRANRRSRQ